VLLCNKHAAFVADTLSHRLRAMWAVGRALKTGALRLSGRVEAGSGCCQHAGGFEGWLLRGQPSGAR
jgi:hypothetical protein